MNHKSRIDALLWTACMSFAVAFMLFEAAVANARTDRAADPTTAAEESFARFRQANETSWILYRKGEQTLSTPSVQPAPAAIKAAVDPSKQCADALVDAIIQIESGGNAGRVGRQGERGLMQVKKDTWKAIVHSALGRRASFDEAFDPSLNRRVGTAYLRQLQDYLAANRSKWKADERSLLLACYNAGPSRVKEGGFSIGELPATTQDYVKRASALHDLFVQGGRSSTVATL